MKRARQGRFVEEPLPSLCEWVAHPDVPSPAGGTVVAACGALVTALAELILRVSRNRRERRRGDGSEVFSETGVTDDVCAQLDSLLEEAAALRAKLLEYGEGDVYEAARIIQGERAACVRKDVGSPAKIAGTLVKLLRLTESAAEHVPAGLLSDLRVVAHMGHAAVFGITEIALANINSAGGGDDVLLARIERWRQEATSWRDRLLART